jgi:hypothetical protein
MLNSKDTPELPDEGVPVSLEHSFGSVPDLDLGTSLDEIRSPDQDSSAEVGENLRSQELIGAKSSDIREALLLAGKECDYDVEALPSRIHLPSERIRVFAAHVSFPSVESIESMGSEELSQRYRNVLGIARTRLFDPESDPTEEEIREALKDDFIARFVDADVNVRVANSTRVTGHFCGGDSSTCGEEMVVAFQNVLSGFGTDFDIDFRLASELYRVAIAPSRDPNVQLVRVGPSCYESSYGNEAISKVNAAVSGDISGGDALCAIDAGKKGGANVRSSDKGIVYNTQGLRLDPVPATISDTPGKSLNEERRLSSEQREFLNQIRYNTFFSDAEVLAAIQSDERLLTQLESGVSVKMPLGACEVMRLGMCAPEAESTEGATAKIDFSGFSRLSDYYAHLGLAPDEMLVEPLSNLAAMAERLGAKVDEYAGDSIKVVFFDDEEASYVGETGPLNSQEKAVLYQLYCWHSLGKSLKGIRERGLAALNMTNFPTAQEFQYNFDEEELQTVREILTGSYRGPFYISDSYLLDFETVIMMQAGYESTGEGYESFEMAVLQDDLHDAPLREVNPELLCAALALYEYRHKRLDYKITAVNESDVSLVCRKTKNGRLTQSLSSPGFDRREYAMEDVARSHKTFVVIDSAMYEKLGPAFQRIFKPSEREDLYEVSVTLEEVESRFLAKFLE